MAKSKPVLGRDTLVSLIMDNVTVAEIDSVKSCAIKFRIELVEENYLGRTDPEFDSVSNGCELDIKHNVTDDKYLTLVDKMVAAASDRQKAIVLNVQTTIKFSTGRMRKVLFPNCAYGDIPLDIPERKRYIESGLQLRCSKGKFLTQ